MFAWVCFTRQRDWLKTKKLTPQTKTNYSIIAFTFPMLSTRNMCSFEFQVLHCVPPPLPQKGLKLPGGRVEGGGGGGCEAELFKGEYEAKLGQVVQSRVNLLCIKL